MKRPQATAQLRLVLAVAFAVLLVGALYCSLRTSGSVMLLHVGYSENGNDPPNAIFCLTNGTSSPIAYGTSSRGEPLRRIEVRSRSGWPNASWASICSTLQICVLRPGQSVVFQSGLSSRFKNWRAGIRYWHCDVRPAENKTSGNTFLGFDASTGLRDIDARPFSGSVVLRERTLMQRVQAKLPKGAPAWLKRYVDSKARSPVVWGPEMNQEGT